MNVSAAVKTRVEAKMRKCHQMAETHYGRKFDFPSIAYTVKGKTGGWALGTKEVNFNAVLLMENIEHFIATTVPHELAHCLDCAVNPHNHNRGGWGKRKVHGTDWQRVMHVIGVKDPTRCHSYDVTNARTRQKVLHEWICTCGATMELGPKRHPKQMANNDAYRPIGKGCRRDAMHTYSYVGVVGVKRVAPKPPPKTPTPPPSHNPPTKGISKKDRAEVIYQRYPMDSRPDMISKFVSSLRMTPAGAATYYANCKKKFG